MTDRRRVAVLAQPSRVSPGLGRAMLEDVIDLVTETPLVSVAVAVVEGAIPVQDLVWPGTPVLALGRTPTLGDVLGALAPGALTPGAPESGGAPPSSPAEPTVAVGVVAADAPDLPSLLLGKLFSAVAGRGPAVAACPAGDGCLTAVAARLPVAGWLTDCDVRLDDPDGLARLDGSAPRGGLQVVAGWRRVRTDREVSRLDPGLEGWNATRDYLGG